MTEQFNQPTNPNGAPRMSLEDFDRMFLANNAGKQAPRPNQYPSAPQPPRPPQQPQQGFNPNQYPSAPQQPQQPQQGFNPNQYPAQPPLPRQYPAQQQAPNGVPQFPTRPENRPAAANPSVVVPAEANTPPKSKEKWSAKKRFLAAVLSLVALGGVGATAYSNNAFGLKDTVEANSAEAENAVEADLGMDLIPLKTLGTESLKDGACDQPAAVLTRITVSGEMPLVPLLATTTNPTPSKTDGWMSEEKMEDMPKDKQELFEKFITDSKYPEATLNELPLGLTICEILDSNAITVTEGHIVINRSALKVKIQDVDRLFERNIILKVLQSEQAENLELKPDLGEYMTIPDPAWNFFIEKTKEEEEDYDQVYNTSVDELNTNMVDPNQVAAILAYMESSAIKQLDDVYDGEENITYPDGAETFTEAIDKALLKRLVGDDDVTIEITGNYAIDLVTFEDPTTKELYPLKNLDMGQEFKITDITVEYGAIAEPAIIEPEPEPTPAPTEEAANETEG